MDICSFPQTRSIVDVSSVGSRSEVNWFNTNGEFSGVDLQEKTIEVFLMDLL